MRIHMPGMFVSADIGSNRAQRLRAYREARGHVLRASQRRLMPEWYRIGHGNLPPLKFFEAGRKNRAVDAIIRQNVRRRRNAGPASDHRHRHRRREIPDRGSRRLPDVVAHDLDCEMAVNSRAAQSFDTAIADSEALMREEIAAIPDGSYR